MGIEDRRVRIGLRVILAGEVHDKLVKGTWTYVVNHSIENLNRGTGDSSPLLMRGGAFGAPPTSLLYHLFESLMNAPRTLVSAVMYVV